VIEEPPQDAALWPELPWPAWADTLATLHMWTQIVGKLRLAASPPASHWWHAPLYVTARGLTTSAMPHRGRLFQVDFDFIAHRVLIAESDGRAATIELAPKSVARFYREVMAALHSLDIEISILPRPVEVAEAIPFDEDEVHATYDPRHAHAFWQALIGAHRLLTVFAARFVGKAAPVHFFWGSFDLATSRFSGRRAPTHPGGMPNCPPWVMEEAYSHEVSSAGWWPLSRELGPAFYAYIYPEPPGYREASVRPAGGRFDTGLGEFILRHDDVRILEQPDEAVIAFLEDTYARAADLAHWPRQALEPADYPIDGNPRRAWSTSTSEPD
jgi:hypothetical protein